MPIAPITGKLRKRLWLDLTTGAGLGTVFAYGYWYYHYVPSVRRRQDFYIALEQKRKEEGAL